MFRGLSRHYFKNNSKQDSLQKLQKISRSAVEGDQSSSIEDLPHSELLKLLGVLDEKNQSVMGKKAIEVYSS